MQCKTILAAALAAGLLSAGAASAADVQIYGRVDAGLRWTHTDDDDKLALQAGNRAHNRIGLNIVEDLGNGMKVKGYLENGFTIDDGAMDDSEQIFNRRSILAIQGSWGEVGMGRMGTVQSTVAPYTMGLIKWDPFATSYSQASIGTTFANTSRVNNAITWQSPSISGWRLGATYSLGDSTDDDYAVMADRDHTFAAATDYTSENLYLSATYATVQYGKKETSTMADDAQLVGLGGWYRFMPEAKVYFGAQYQQHWEKAAKMTLTNVTDTSYENSKSSGFDGYSLLLGGTYEFGQHKLLGSVQYFDGELSQNNSADYQFTVLGLAWEYKLAKKVWFYVAATNSWASGKLQDQKDYEATELMSGINWNF